MPVLSYAISMSRVVVRNGTAFDFVSIGSLAILELVIVQSDSTRS